MGPEHFGEGWWMFPMIMCMVMMFIAFMIFGQGRCRPPWMRGGGRSQNNDKSSSETPMEILEKRYAQGEISKTEFDQMKSDLQ